MIGQIMSVANQNKCTNLQASVSHPFLK